MDDLVQAMATTEFWIELAFVIVFGGGWFACYRAATKAERGGNKRRAIILGIASIAILIAGFVIESHFGIFDDDGDSGLRGDHAATDVGNAFPFVVQHFRLNHLQIRTRSRPDSDNRPVSFGVWPANPAPAPMPEPSCAGSVFDAFLWVGRGTA